MNPLVLPLNIGKDGTLKLSWKNRYFLAKGAIILQHKISTEVQALAALENSQLVLKLIEFKTSLRSKMLEALSSQRNTTPSKNDFFGLVAQINIKKGLLSAIDDVRRASTENASDSADFLGDSAEVLQLTETERQELITALQQALTPQVLEAMRQLFVPFCTELSETWKDQNLSSIQADKLVPFQILFPNSQHIERIADGERYVIDDLYCTNPKCSCTDVTCVVLKFLPSSGTEVAWGGFVWNSETNKFKTLPQFSNKFNAAEWFKKFNTASPIDLNLLLKTRQKFMRTQFISARQALK